MTTQTTTKFMLLISAPGHMEEVPEATVITVDGDETVAKRVFAGELRMTAAAVGEEIEGMAAEADLLDHPLSETPFSVSFGQWVCIARGQA
jgi:hypothetical protein